MDDRVLTKLSQSKEKNKMKQTYRTRPRQSTIQHKNWSKRKQKELIHKEQSIKQLEQYHSEDYSKVQVY